MRKQRDEKYVEQLKIIQRWRWTAKKFRGKAGKSLEKRGLWAATEALTLDARAWVLEQCARDLWRHLRGREVWPESPEMREIRESFEDVRARAEKLSGELGMGAV